MAAEKAIPRLVHSRRRRWGSGAGGGRGGADGAGQGVVAGGRPGAHGERAAALPGAHGAGTRPRRAAPRGAGAGLEPGDDPQGAARVGERLRLRRRLRTARAQARRGASPASAGRPGDRRRRAEPGRSLLPHDAPLHAADCGRGAPPTHRAAGLHGRGAAMRADDRREIERAGVLSPDGGEEPAPKKIAATDAIFAEVTAVNRAADADPDALRVSLDAKATVKLGPFSRRGKSRVAVAAADHDFQPAGTVTPVGLLLPEWDELVLYAVTSRVTSDCLVDRLAQWWDSVCARFAHITTLFLNLDNGPENHSQRTQFVARLVQFAADTGLTV